MIFKALVLFCFCAILLLSIAEYALNIVQLVLGFKISNVISGITQKKVLFGQQDYHASISNKKASSKLRLLQKQGVPCHILSISYLPLQWRKTEVPVFSSSLSGLYSQKLSWCHISASDTWNKENSNSSEYIANLTNSVALLLLTERKSWFSVAVSDDGQNVN